MRVLGTSCGATAHERRAADLNARVRIGPLVPRLLPKFDSESAVMDYEARKRDTSEDAVLGGRLSLRQPRRGHRFGHDAILLAAATQARAGEHAIELGAGVGAAGLALAQRVPGVTMTLVEIDPELAGLAAENAERNGLGERVRIAALDVTASEQEFSKFGIEPSKAAHVLMNPPFNDPARQNVSPDPKRRLAHAAPGDT